MKPPYYNLTATCSVHGKITVQRKPNPKGGQKCDSGGLIPFHPQSIVCPHCGYLLKKAKAELITTGGIK